jgi:hypothetical protein
MGGNMENKVYCKDCRYLKEFGFSFLCKSPENKILKEGDTWFEHYKRKDINKNPYNINRENNCKNYKRKWWKIWVR